jgi:hypothetical protein
MTSQIKDDLNDEDDVEEEDEGEEYLKDLEMYAAEALRAAHDSKPECVSPRFLNPNLEIGRQGKHPWGKQANESAPVPVEFQEVSLGPVIIVCPPKGFHLPRLGTPHASTLVVYQDGFAYQAGGRDVKLWRFDEVTAIQSNLVDRGYFHKEHKYSLIRNNGETLILDDDVQFVQAAEYQIKLALFKRLVESFVRRYEAGEALTFGRVTVQQQSGLQLGGHSYAWQDIQNVEVSLGKLELTLGNNQHKSVRTYEIPNFELLGRLIGLDQAPSETIQMFYSSFRYS